MATHIPGDYRASNVRGGDWLSHTYKPHTELEETQIGNPIRKFIKSLYRACRVFIENVGL